MTDDWKINPILIIEVKGRMATEFHDIFTTTTPRRATVKMANSTKLPGIDMMTSRSQNAQRHTLYFKFHQLQRFPSQNWIKMNIIFREGIQATLLNSFDTPTQSIWVLKMPLSMVPNERKSSALTVMADTERIIRKPD